MTCLTAFYLCKQTLYGPPHLPTAMTMATLVRPEVDTGQGHLNADQWPSTAWYAGLFQNRKNWASPVLFLPLAFALSLKRSRGKFLAAPGADLKGYEVDPGIGLPDKIKSSWIWISDQQKQQNVFSYKYIPDSAWDILILKSYSFIMYIWNSNVSGFPALFIC